MKNMKFFITSLILLCAVITTNAQVGIGTDAPQGALDITTTALLPDGLLIPRVALVFPLTTAVVTTPTVSEMVYNTTTDAPNSLAPGFFYWNGTTWVKLGVSTATGWEITGNTGTSASTNFMGTTDDVDVIFRRFNTRAGRLGLTNTSFGLSALNTAATGLNNTAFGKSALAANTSGASNVAVGVNALATNTTTANNTAVGFNALTVNTAASNTALGSSAMAANTTGTNNVAIGLNALAVNTSTSSNVALGTGAIAGYTQGSQNTAVGHNALSAPSVAANNNNTALGFRALAANATGNNTAVGASALAANTSGAGNTALGVSSLAANTTAGSNTAVGYFALNANNGQWNTAVGYNALVGISGAAAQNNVAVGFATLSKNTVAASNMNQNVAVGSQALQNNESNDGTAVGNKALLANTSGLANTAVGQSALLQNVSGNQNTAVGAEALYSATGGSNTGIGYQALRGNTGSANVALGWQAGYGTGTGTDNVFVGTQTGDANTSGSSNVFVGKNAGNVNTQGSNNVAVGVNAGNAHVTSSNNVNIGFQTGFANTTGNNVNVGTQAGASNISGSGNVNIGYQAGYAELTSNKLYIANTAANATAALIYGEFNATPASQVLRTNAQLQIGNPAGTGYVFPIARGTDKQLLTTDAAGVLSWTAPETAPNSSLSVVRANLSANQVLTGIPGGWEKINFNTEAYDTNSEFTGGTFTAAKTGYYQINAGYHTDVTSTVALFGISIYVGGILYRESTYDHNSNQVNRSVNATAFLTAGQTVEVYVRNPDAGRNIDAFSGKTYFEIVQIR